MNTEPRTIPDQKPYYNWDDLTDEVSLHNRDRWLVFPRSSLTTDAAKLNAVRQLLDDSGIDKAQIGLLLGSLDKAQIGLLLRSLDSPDSPATDAT